MQIDEVATEIRVDHSGAGSSGTAHRAKSLAPKKKLLENICIDCQADFSKYHGPDWLQCLSCRGWVCGMCNNEVSPLGFQCGRCANDSDVESD